MAAGTVSVDSMLADAISKMDALTKRMDALETGEGSKNPIKGDDDDKKKDDAVKAKSDDDDDAKKKKDDATTPKNKILDDDDDDDDKKDDAFPPKKMKDDAASVKFGDDGELEIKHEPSEEKKKGDKRKDSVKKADATQKSDAKKSDDDDDDDAKKSDETAKADSVSDLRRQIADQSAMIRRLESLMKPKSDDEHAAFADAQARADAVFNGFGQRAPRPLEGETLFDYRKRLATKLKGYSPVWKSVKFSQLPEEAFGIAESQVYADATTAASNPVDLEPGELREVVKFDPRTNRKTIVFYGKESFVKQLGRPGRRVQAFRTMGSV